MESAILGLRCPDCGEGALNTDMTVHPVCPRHGRFQEARYDLAKIAGGVDRDSLRPRRRGIWRYRALLPVRDDDHVVTMGEGDTPLVHARRLGAEIGLDHLYVKDESQNPTGSFKDRGASVTLSKCKEVGVKGLILASSGNAASSFSAYSARAGLPFVGFIRRETSAVHRLQTLIYGAEIYVVEGTMVEGTQLAQAVADKHGLFHCTQPYNLYRVEGKKTLAFEISESLGWRVPDRILVPTAGGTNALALYKGYEELNALGWVKGMPAIDVVQAEGCHPIVLAWKSGEPVKRWAKVETKSVGLGHPFPKAGDQVVEIMKKTGGIGWVVSDAHTFAAARLLARTEGLFVQPASAAPVACFLAMGEARARKGHGGQLIVGIASGSGKNQVDAPLAELGEPPLIEARLDAFEAARTRR
ncbi:MAG: threonine synthase [Proteobacteria bacterium]|nr:threonine synthase [Pseudomonadota bacterium]